VAEHPEEGRGARLGPITSLAARLQRIRALSFSLRAAWLLSLVVALLAAAPLVRFVAQPGEEHVQQAEEDFFLGRTAVAHAIVVHEGFRANEDGWYLLPHSGGSLVYRINKPRELGLLIQVRMDMRFPQVTGQLSARMDGGSAETIAENQRLEGDRIDLPAARGAAQVDLQFSAANASADTPLILSALWWATTAGELPKPPPAYAVWGLGALVGLGSLALVRPRRGAPGIALALGLITVGAATLRLFWLGKQVGTILDPDAITYRFYADKFHWWPLDQGVFCGCFSEREPFFILLIRSTFDLLGSSDFHLRILSVALSLAVVLLSIVAARRRLAWPSALAIGILIALNIPLVHEGARGLRTELETVCLLLLYLLLDRGPDPHPGRDALGTALVAAASVLTRTYYLPTVVAGALISYFSRYRPKLQALALLTVVLAVAMAAEAGHRYGFYHTHHDPFYDSYVAGRAWANLEKYQYHRALPHPELFPSESEVAEHLVYFGPRLSYLQYLLLLHPLSEVVGDTVLGYWDVFQAFDGFLRFNSLALQLRPIPILGIGDAVDWLARWLGILGLLGLLVSAVRRPRNAILPVMVLSSLVVQTFLYHRGMLERYRLTMEVYPLVLIAGAWLVEVGFRRLRGSPMVAKLGVMIRRT
jgi:hypothetical protein